MAYTPPTAYGPLSGQVTYNTGLQIIDELLTNLAKQFRPDGFLYDRIVAGYPVNYNIGRYPVFNPADFFQTGGDLEVADDAPTPIIDFSWSTDVFHCKDKRLQTRITRKEELQANPALRLDYSKTIGLLTVFTNNREFRLAAKLRAQANGGQFTNAAVNPAVQWDLGTVGAPAKIQKDLQAAAMLSYKQTGKWPNTLILDKEIALALAADPTIQTLVQYLIGTQIVSSGGGAGSTTTSAGTQGFLPPTLFGFNVLVADGTLYNQARPGQTANLAGTWGNSVRLVYRDSSPQWGMPATVYAFRGRVTDGNTQAPSTIMPSGDGGSEPGPAGGWAIVDRWWDIDPPGMHIRAWECVDERVVAPELGVEIQNVLSVF